MVSTFNRQLFQSVVPYLCTYFFKLPVIQRFVLIYSSVNLEINRRHIVWAPQKPDVFSIMNAVSYFLALKKCQSTIIKNQFWQSQRGAVRSCSGLVACWLSTWPATRQCYIAKPCPDHFATIRQTSIVDPALTSLLSVNVEGRKVTFVFLLPTTHQFALAGWLANNRK